MLRLKNIKVKGNYIYATVVPMDTKEIPVFDIVVGIEEDWIVENSLGYTNTYTAQAANSLLKTYRQNKNHRMPKEDVVAWC